MSEIMLGVGLAAKLENALRRNGISDLADIDWLASGDNITRVRELRLGPVNVVSDGVIRRDTTHLRYLFPVNLTATRGSVTLAQSAAVFTGYIDPNFKNWGTDVPGKDTEPVTALVYQMDEDGRYKDLLDSFGTGWRNRMPTQGQIVTYCTEHRSSLLRTGFGNFFPFQVKPDGEEALVFVAYVGVCGGQLEVNVCQLEDSCVWNAGNRHRVVVLQEQL